MPDSGRPGESRAEPTGFGTLKDAEVEYLPMRRTLFRILAVALLALAVPVQGLAAASAALCMAMGGHDGQGHAAAALQ